jgi:hypothetical protein
LTAPRRHGVLAAVKLELKNLGPWIFGTEQLKRFTQDSPVRIDLLDGA